MNHQKYDHWILIGLLLIFGFVMRLLPHAANVAPIGAIALFAGIYLPPRWALLLPVGVMLASDLIVGLYSLPIMITVYASFVCMGLIGLWVRKHKTPLTLLGGTVVGSILFFLLTNAAVWAFGTMYPHTVAGLLQSYMAGLPFLRNTLIGDLMYVGLLIGGYELVRTYITTIDTQLLSERRK